MQRRPLLLFAPYLLGGIGMGGGGILALILLVVFVWGTIDMNRRGAEEQQVSALRDKIVRYVNAHPQFNPAAPDDIIRSPALDDADRKLIQKTSLKLHPVNANSAPESLVLLRPVSGGERYYYKGRGNDFMIRWPAPAGSLAVMSAPKAPGEKIRVVSLIDTRANTTLLRYEVPALFVTTLWRPDGRAVAVNETAPDQTRFRVIHFSAAGAIESLLPPPEAQPIKLLPPGDLADAAEIRWLSDQITAQKWLPSGELETETFANVALLGEDRRPHHYVVTRARCILRLADSRLSIEQRQIVAYQRTEAKGPVPVASTRSSGL